MSATPAGAGNAESGGEASNDRDLNDDDSDDTKREAEGDDALPESLDDIDEAQLPGQTLAVEVPGGGFAYVSLADVEVVEVTSPDDSLDWDLAFSGSNIFTNSGPSGPGDGAAFGPHDELDFLLDEGPEAPFLREDTAGSAFTDWYYYDDETHTLWSRFHTYGVHDGSNLWKVQVLSYYGDAEGAPVSALYSVRYARLAVGDSSETQQVDKLDATAGGAKIDEEAPSACIDLSENEVLMLTPEQASDDHAWDICFRRDVITTNGGVGGPGEVTAVDVHAKLTEDEDIEDLNAESELAAFESFDYDALTRDDLRYVADAPLSIFDDIWYETDTDGIEPAAAAWLVRGADGTRRYSMVVLDIESGEDDDKLVTLRVRRVEDD